MQESGVTDEKKDSVWWQGMTDEEITESYNRVYGPMGGKDPETREFRKEAARRAFERSEWED